MKPDDRTRELLWRHVDGSLTADEAAELSRILAAHPGLAADLFRMADERLAMEEALRDAPAASPATPRRRPVAVTHASPRPAFAWGLGVAAAACLAVLAWTFLTDTGPRAPVVAARKERILTDAPPARKPDPRVPAPPAAAKAPDAAPPPPPLVVEKPAPPPSPPDPATPPPVPPSVDDKTATASPGTPAPSVAEMPGATPARPAPPETAVSVARLSEAEGAVFVLSPDADDRKTPARAGQPLLAGQGLATVGASSRAVVTWPDRTRLDLAADSAIDRLTEGESPAAAKGSAGKRVALARGTVTADVPRQPAGRPMVFATPQAEATVLGTRLTLTASPGATRLEVKEGRVRLTRTADGKSVDVPGGSAAVAATGTELAARPAPPAAPEAREAPAPLPPGMRVLFQEGFSSRADGWQGERSLLPPEEPRNVVMRGRPRSDRSDANLFFAEVRTPWDARGWPVGRHTYLRFRYGTDGFTDKQCLKIQVKRSDGANYGGFLTGLAAGRPAVATVRLTGVRPVDTDRVPAGQVLAAGESLRELAWFGYAVSGPPPAGARFWIDDVLLLESPVEIPAEPLKPLP